MRVVLTETERPTVMVWFVLSANADGLPGVPVPVGVGVGVGVPGVGGLVPAAIGVTGFDGVEKTPVSMSLIAATLNR